MHYFLMSVSNVLLRNACRKPLHYKPLQTIILFSAFTFCTCMNLIGFEVLEMDDLILISPSAKVGNLDHGDPCRNAEGTDITDDFCFHSNHLFQCNGGRCECGFVRLSDNRVEQMVFQNGSCKRLEQWGCNKTQDCANGLICKDVKSVEVETSGEQDTTGARKQRQRFQHHFEHDGEKNAVNKFRNHFQERMKKKLDIILGPNGRKYKEQDEKSEDENSTLLVQNITKEGEMLIHNNSIRANVFDSSDHMQQLKRRNAKPILKFCVKSAALRTFSLNHFIILEYIILTFLHNNW